MPDDPQAHALEAAAKAHHDHRQRLRRDGIFFTWGELMQSTRDELIEAQRAAIAAYEHAMWSDRMEDAPRDGQCLLLCADRWQTSGCWNRHRQAWCNNGPGYPPYGRDEQPTYWRPAPPLP